MMVSAVFKLNEPTKTKGSGCYVPRRYIVTLMGFFATLIIFSQRSNWSVVIVAMVNSSKHTNGNSSELIAECPNIQETQTDVTDLQVGHFDWDSTEQGHVLGAYFYGYFITLLLGGYFAEKFGAVRTTGGCVLVHSILDVLAPSATTLGLIPTLVLRGLQGLFGGSLLPSLNTIISRWSPKMERSRIFTIMFTGIPMGTVVGFTFSGYISSAEYLGGWPTVFYSSGAAGICWFLVWSLIVYETPSSHPSITAEELRCFPPHDANIQPEKWDVPWRQILTSLPAWAVFIGTIGAYFRFVIMLSELPTYLSNVLHFNVKSSGVFSTLPYIAHVIGSLISSQIADKLRESGKCNITTIRKLFNSISGYCMGICLIAVTFCGCRPVWIIGLVTFGMFMEGAKFCGFNVICVDMCPELAGFLFGICNGIASLSGIIGPAMVGHLVAEDDTIANWGYVFYATAGISILSATFFLLFASAELQPWAKAEPKKEKDLSGIKY